MDKERTCPYCANGKTGKPTTMKGRVCPICGYTILKDDI